MKSRFFYVLTSILLLTCLALTGGCNKQDDQCSMQEGEPLEGCQSDAQATQLAAANSASADKSTGGTVARIVFVDKQRACACTQKKIDASMTALKSVLDQDGAIPVQTIHYDTQPQLVDPLREQQALVALPAIYFVDEQDQVVHLLQGDVNEQMLRQVLGGES